jgi:hypothetical protein
MSEIPNEREIRKKEYADGRNAGLAMGGVAGLVFGHLWGRTSFLWAAGGVIGLALIVGIIGGIFWGITRWIDKATERQKDLAALWAKWLIYYPLVMFMFYMAWDQFIR